MILRGQKLFIYYEKGYFTPKDILKFSPGFLSTVTSDDAFTCYEKGHIDPKNLIDLKCHTVKYMINKSSQKFYESNNISKHEFSTLIDIYKNIQSAQTDLTKWNGLIDTLESMYDYWDNPINMLDQAIIGNGVDIDEY